MSYHQYYVYIMTNRFDTVVYTGVTNNLERRVREHKEQKHKNSFTSRYKINKLVYYETFKYIDQAIAREKQIKAGSRKKKEELINSINPRWEDLSIGWY
ncbi:MAG: GIY-YIG nuclease family protein [Chitinophagales bacterium]